VAIRSKNRTSRKGIGGRPRCKPTKVVRMPLPIANLARRLAEGTLRAGDINGFLDIETRTPLTVPLVSSTASCGFPSPADDYLDRPLDFNELLVQNPAATFAVRISGESMTGAGLFPNDIAVVDRSITPTNGCIVLALIEGEFTIKRYCRVDGGIVLLAENPLFPNIEISAESGLEVWGVLKHAIRML
jgi:DNA polymerase V